MAEQFVDIHVPASAGKYLSTGVDEIHAATDSVYASSRSHPDPRWLLMEINAAEPQLVFESQQPDVSRTQTGMLADQLIRIMQHSEG
jgi:hypothetical protein